MKNDVQRTIDALIKSGARRAVCYLSPKYTVQVTRRRRRGQVEKANRYYGYFAVTIGSPNYAQRQFIKIARKAGEPFPIKKVQLTHPR